MAETAVFLALPARRLPRQTQHVGDRCGRTGSFAGLFSGLRVAGIGAQAYWDLARRVENV